MYNCAHSVCHGDQHSSNYPDNTADVYRFHHTSCTVVLQTVKPKMLSPKNNQSESTTHFRM